MNTEASLQDEAALIRAAQRGDISSFNALVLAYQALAYNVAYRLLGDADLAADATQEAFLSAFRHLQALRGTAFRPWLLRIVTRTCYDVLRRRQREMKRTVELDADTDEEKLRRASSWLQVMQQPRSRWLSATSFGGSSRVPSWSYPLSSAWCLC